MKEKKTDKRAYMEPVCESFAVEAEQLLQSASGNAGMIGPGAGGGDAKQGWFEEEEEDWDPDDDVDGGEYEFE